MSPADSSKKPGGPYRKPKADVYTVLLVLALVAILLGILFLYLEMDAYEWKFKGGPSVRLDRPNTLAIVGRPEEPGRTIAAVPAAAKHLPVAAVPAVAKLDCCAWPICTRT